jgi:hypothetical protein
MFTGKFQTSSDEVEMGRSPLRPQDSQKTSGGTLQYAGADSMEPGTHEVHPPYSNPGNKGSFQMGGADEVELKHSGHDWPFSNQASGVLGKDQSD